MGSSFSAFVVFAGTPQRREDARSLMVSNDGAELVRTQRSEHARARGCFARSADSAATLCPPLDHTLIFET